MDKRTHAQIVNDTGAREIARLRARLEQAEKDVQWYKEIAGQYCDIDKALRQRDEAQALLERASAATKDSEWRLRDEIDAHLNGESDE